MPENDVFLKLSPAPTATRLPWLLPLALAVVVSAFGCPRLEIGGGNDAGPSGAGGQGGAGGRLPDEETSGVITHGDECRGRDYPGGGATGGSLGCGARYTELAFDQPLSAPGAYAATVKVGRHSFQCAFSLPGCAGGTNTCTDGGWPDMFFPSLAWTTSGDCAAPSAVTLTGLRLSSQLFEELIPQYVPVGSPLPGAIEVALVRDGTPVASGTHPLVFHCQHFGHCSYARGERVVIPVAR